MDEWMDFNGDGIVDGFEEIMGEELCCSSREEHEALFGDAGEFGEDDEEDEDEYEEEDDDY